MLAITVHGVVDRLDDIALDIDRQSWARCPRQVEFSRRGHVRVAGVGDAPWTVRLESAAAGGVQAVMNRSALLAAATVLDGSEHVLTTPDGSVTAVVGEDEDHHLVAEFRGELAGGTLVLMRWTTLTEAEELIERTLVTPLAAKCTRRRRRIRPWRVGYRTRTGFTPLDVVENHDVPVDLIGAACDQVWFGSARRAWTNWLSESADVAAPVRAMLEERRDRRTSDSGTGAPCIVGARRRSARDLRWLIGPNGILRAAQRLAEHPELGAEIGDPTELFDWLDDHCLVSDVRPSERAAAWLAVAELVGETEVASVDAVDELLRVIAVGFPAPFALGPDQFDTTAATITAGKHALESLIEVATFGQDELLDDVIQAVVPRNRPLRRDEVSVPFVVATRSAAEVLLFSVVRTYGQPSTSIDIASAPFLEADREFRDRGASSVAREPGGHARHALVSSVRNQWSSGGASERTIDWPRRGSFLSRAGRPCVSHRPQLGVYRCGQRRRRCHHTDERRWSERVCGEGACGAVANVGRARRRRRYCRGARRSIGATTDHCGDRSR